MTVAPLPADDAKPLFVVGVGASAGGLEALHKMFERVPRNGAVAFVVVQHLSPDFKSVMDELLSPHTALDVRRAQDNVEVEPDVVYLMPPGQEMIIAQGRLRLSQRPPTKSLSLPIDTFFRSLAEDVGPRSVAVVLSGTGSDGSRGLRAVHEAGGLVIAQTQSSAKFDGMPRTAIETGVVDLVLSPEVIGEALVRYVEQDGRLGESDTNIPSDVMGRVFDLLRRESGIDFGEYKPGMVARRIERRLLLSDTHDLDRYVSRIGEDPDELRALYRDLLIGVTRFFRDGPAFERLRADVLPELIERLPAGDELRAWIPACATGEEAYSLAILMSEAFREAGRPALFRLFATDVHRTSLELASAGVFSDDALTGVPDELRAKYFEPCGSEGRLRVCSDLRGHIVFAHHNILKDAPFTRLDLLSCRNLLIYLKPPAQRRALALFHFGLKTGGVLLLGPSETPGQLTDEFATVDQRWRIFRKTRDVRIAAEVRLGLPPLENLSAVSPRSSEDVRVVRGREALLERFAPPSVVVDEDNRLVHTFNGAGEFLLQRDGRPSLDVLDLLSGELRFAVAGALKRAQRDRAPVSYGQVTVPDAQGPRRLIVGAQPIDGGDRGACYLVTFEPDRAQPPVTTTEPIDVGDLLHDRLSLVENELRVTKENLQATIEEMETSNEELQATNEELIASNEELQSTNEELHSVNEELYTVNAEYQAKIGELTELTADMNHLLEATEVHTLFLDRELRLRKFTPKIAETFNVLPQDVGRRVDVFAHTLQDEDLLSELSDVLTNGSRIEREVKDRQGRSFFLRLLPYRANQTIEGVVLTLIEMSALKRAQHELSVSAERYRTLLRAITAALWTADAQGRFTEPQAEWESYTGQAWSEHQGDGWLSAVHEEDRTRFAQAWRSAVRQGRFFEAEGRIYSRHHDGHRHVVARAAPLLDETGSVREWIGHVVDLHDAKTVALELQRKDSLIDAILEHSPAFIWVKDLSGRYLVAGRPCEEILGVPREQVLGRTDFDFLPVSVADQLRASERRVLEGESEEFEEELPLDGETRTFLSIKFPLRSGGTSYAIAGVTADITQRKRDSEEAQKAVERRDRFLAMLSHELRTPLGAILNAADLLDRGTDAPPAPGTPREIIRRQTRHMAKLIEDLLDVGRITRDQLTLEPRLLDLRAAIQDAVDTVRPELERKRLQLRIHLPEVDIPVRGDGVRLRQIFTNLLSNAVSYTPDGTVEVSAEPNHANVRVHVRDTGIGLRPEELDRVFEIFFQTEQALDRKRGGLGVGLTLAQRLARLHGGDLTAHSEGHGQGSVFTVTLPMSKGEAVVPPQPRPVVASALDIVLVEDNEDIRETLAELLRLEGHQVRVATDGLSGAKLITESCPDVAIVDVGLPLMDGYAVARAVRSSCGPRVPLVALTGYGRHEDRVRAVDAGFDRHLIKPIDSEVLLQTLEDLARAGAV